MPEKFSLATAIAGTIGLPTGAACAQDQPRFPTPAMRWLNGEQQVVDPVAVTGFHVVVSTVAAGGRIPIPNGAPAPMPVLVK